MVGIESLQNVIKSIKGLSDAKLTDDTFVLFFFSRLEIHVEMLRSSVIEPLLDQRYLSAY